MEFWRRYGADAQASPPAQHGYRHLADFTARDLFDFALVAEREPEALEDANEILLARRAVLLEQITDQEEALREDFAALDVLEYRPSFEECVDVVRNALVPGTGRAPHRAKQQRARYRASLAAIGWQTRL